MFNKFNNWLFRPIFHVKQRLFLTAHTMGHPIDPSTSRDRKRLVANAAQVPMNLAGRL
jgi:hypothetical protein